MEMYFRQYWKDARLAFPKLNGPVTFSGELPDVLWQPRTLKMASTVDYTI